MNICRSIEHEIQYFLQHTRHRRQAVTIPDSFVVVCRRSNMSNIFCYSQCYYYQKLHTADVCLALSMTHEIKGFFLVYIQNEPQMMKAMMGHGRMNSANSFTTSRNMFFWDFFISPLLHTRHDMMTTILIWRMDVPDYRLSS